MPVISLEIDNVKYEVECNEGEETLLKESEKLINNRFKENKQIKNLPQSKKYLMISLLLAGEVNTLKNQNQKKATDLELIINELDKLENLVEEKLNG